MQKEDKVIEVLESSIKWWTKIRNGRDTYSYEKCDLCRYQSSKHGEAHKCDDCPLKETGNRCRDKDSAYHRFRTKNESPQLMIDALEKALEYIKRGE